jgi:hypothetical protein
MSRWAVRLAWIALALSAFYSMTAIVFSGCEPSYNLVLKPWPMWGWSFGGSESDCYWSTSHPGEPEPWWLNAPNLAYASMEDAGGGLLSLIYTLGWLATFLLLWPLTLILGAIGAVQSTLRRRASSPTS